MGGAAEELSAEYSSIIVRTAADFLGRRKRGDSSKGYEWWSPELDAQRRAVYTARRAWQRSRRSDDLELQDRTKQALSSARRTYKASMRDSETAFFRNIIAEAGNDDPWGRAYRAASGRVRPPPNVINGVKLAEGYAETGTEAASGLLSALCPDDDPGRDTAYHRQVRVAAACAPSNLDIVAPTADQLKHVIETLPNTAPGLDGLTPRIIRRAWRVSGAEMLEVYAACIRQGIFPAVWKTGRLVVLPKGNDKPLTDPKAYRPVTLLPILGKILERLVIAVAPCLHRTISPNQHGFRCGRSTVSAIDAVIDVAANTPRKYVQAIMLDISGAFDNAWWPMVLLKSKQTGCSQNIYRLLCSYFTGRRVGLFLGRQTVWKTATMGCPQGSVLGPTLWNLLIDDVLRLPVPEGVHVVAYADDITIVIEAASRAEIERLAQPTLQLVSEWGTRNRLAFSAAKSQTITLKGKLQRPPTIRMDGASIASVSGATLLGVRLDVAGSFLQHAELSGQKAVRCFGKMARVSASSWGTRFKALKIVYGGTYVPCITYAAAVWWHRASGFTVSRSLLRSQRPAMVLLTKAYRSVSTPALPVLAGVLPSDLEVIRAGRVAREVPERSTGRERRQIKRRITEEVVSIWQDRWTTSDKGRDLFAFFPDVRERLRCRWVEPDYAVSQVLTGHGNFKHRLHNMRLVESGECRCGESIEDRDHILWECTLYDEYRRDMLDGWSRSVEGPVYFGELVNDAEGFDRLRRFAHRWLRRRTELEDEEQPA